MPRVISASTKERCEGDTCTHVKPLSRTYSLRAGLRHRSQRKRGFLSHFSLLQNVMSCSGGRRLGVLAGLAQKGSICACPDIKVMQKPKEYSLMVQLIPLAKCKLLSCSVSRETSVPRGTTARLEAN